MPDAWPISFEAVLAARDRLAPHLPPTPLRPYAPLDAAVGHGIRVLVKHENHQPTNAFKVRNAISFMTTLDAAQRGRGVIAASRGNHGLGLAWAGERLGIRVVVCVPVGNNPEKNEGMRGLGAEVIERGRDYDESAEVAAELARSRGMTMAHATGEPLVVAGAATITLEVLEQDRELDAMVISVGGGSQAVGALTVARALRPGMAVYGVQAAGASAIHDAWHAGAPVSKPSAVTFADGLATRNTYPLTFPALREGLAGFVAVSEEALAAAVRLLVRTTHNLVEGAGAAGTAGLLALRETLAGKRVGVILSGGNIDQATLLRVLSAQQ